jgi:hypothetical protein
MAITPRPALDPNDPRASKFVDEPVESKTRKIRQSRILYHGAVIARNKRTTSKKLLRDGLSSEEQDKPRN